MTKILTTFTGLAALLVAVPVYAQDANSDDDTMRPMMENGGSMMEDGGMMRHGGGMMRHGGRMMERLDTDDSGDISMEEFMNMGPARMAEADTNGDGEISFEEMKAAWEARREKRMEAMFKRRFDVDGDGKVTVAELKDRQEKRFALLDANNDGSISPEEFRKGRREMGWGGKHHRKGDDGHRGGWGKHWDD